MDMVYWSIGALNINPCPPPLDSYIPVIVDGVNLGDFIKVKITDATATYLKGDVVSK